MAGGRAAQAGQGDHRQAERRMTVQISRSPTSKGGRMMAISRRRRPPIRPRRSFFYELRTAAPIFIPGLCVGLIRRVVEAVLRPVEMVGPELEKRLRRHVERLDDMPNLNLAKRALRSAMRWLIAERGSEPEPIEEAGHSPTISQADVPAAWGLLQEKQTHLSAGSEGLAEGSANRPEAGAATALDLRGNTVRGVH
jgi:hypothetical protein